MRVDTAPRPDTLPAPRGSVSSAWVDDAAGLDRLREEWNPLLERSKANRVFLTWEWVSIWWRHFGNGRRLAVLLLRDEGGTLRGIAPLYLDVKSTPLGKIRKVQFLGYGGDANPDFLNFIFDKGWEASCMEATLDALLARRGEWDLLKLTDLCEEAPEAALLPDGAGTRGLRVHRFLDTVCPYLPLPDEFESLLAGFRPNLRKEVRYRLRKFLKEPGAEEFSFAAPGRTDEGIEILAHLHQLRMEESKRGGNFKRSTYFRFHRDLMEEFAKHGWLELRILRIRGTDAAANYAFLYDGVLYGYQMGLNPEFYKMSLGTVLLTRIVQDLIAAGYREVDMLRGRSHWKYRWTQHERRNWTFVIESPGFGGRLAFWKDLSANPPGVFLKRVLPERVFAGLQHGVRAAKARFKGGKGP